MKEIEVTSVEVGYDYITLYFLTANNKNEYAKTLYGLFKKSFSHMNIQRKEFSHQTVDQPKFHPLGPPRNAQKKEDWHHFHIIYPGRITREDWKFLYKWGNRKELVLSKKLKKIKIKGRYNDIITD